MIGKDIADLRLKSDGLIRRIDLWMDECDKMSEGIFERLNKINGEFKYAFTRPRNDWSKEDTKSEVD